MAAELLDQASLAEQWTEPEEAEAPRQTKKQRILQLHSEGTTDLMTLAREVETSMNYVATVLTEAGRLTGYYDLFTSTAHPMNQYGKLFQGALSFKTVAAAQASIARIEQLYRYFEFLGDRGGQHHAMLVALTGRNRAMACNKLAEAEIFADWLIRRLATPEAAQEETAEQAA